jgi:hypothetical protein
MTVFANGLEISAKKQGCKVIAAFPDVCFTPPESPATPPGVPVPYPDFGTDSDLTSGSGAVKIGGETISQENSSKYSKCTGDEAGSATKKGAVTSSNRGPIYAQKWSMDVKVESKGVVRFGDLATSNHACNPAETATMPLVGKPNPPKNPDGTECIVGEYGKRQPDCSKNRTLPPPAPDPGPPPKPGGKPYQFHHIIPDRCFRCDRVAVPGLKHPRNVRMTAKGAPSARSGMCICLPPQNHCPSSSSPPGTYSVHGYLDDRLTALGQSSTPKGLASLRAVRGESIAALGKAAKAGVISSECYKLAVKELMEATKEMDGDSLIRAEKSLSNLDSAARGVMKAAK